MIPPKDYEQYKPVKKLSKKGFWFGGENIKSMTFPVSPMVSKKLSLSERQRSNSVKEIRKQLKWLMNSRK
jgi:hypothetical protein